MMSRVKQALALTCMRGFNTSVTVKAGGTVYFTRQGRDPQIARTHSTAKYNREKKITHNKNPCPRIIVSGNTIKCKTIK